MSDAVRGEDRSDNDEKILRQSSTMMNLSPRVEAMAPGGHRRWLAKEMYLPPAKSRWKNDHQKRSITPNHNGAQKHRRLLLTEEGGVLDTMLNDEERRIDKVEMILD